MNKTHQKPNLNLNKEEIDLRELLGVLYDAKWLIFTIIVITSIIGAYYTLSLPNVYHSKAILVANESSNNMSSSLQGYGGIASLAGINLPSDTNSSNSAKAMEKLKSLSFFENNIFPNIYLPELMAVKHWESKTNTLEFDKSIFNSDENLWVRDFSPPLKQIPSVQESFTAFYQDHIVITKDVNNGFVYLTVKHQSPYVAKKWLELLVEEINFLYRNQDKLKAEVAIKFLNEQIAVTNLSEIKQVMANLIQQEIQKLTLIEVNKEYVFDYIDPPKVMEKKSEPKRSTMVAFCAFIGMFFGIFLAIVKNYMINSFDKISYS